MLWRKVLVSLAVWSGVCAAQAQPVLFEEGRDYVTITPAIAGDAPKGSIEVIEFFSYHCPHCAKLDPKVTEWAKQLPRDVVLRRVPVAFQAEWGVGARLFYALEASNQLDKLHAAVFKAVHVDHLRILSDPKILENWVTQVGGDANGMKAAWNAFSTQTKLVKAQQVAAALEIPAVPIMAVDGRFVTSENFVGDPLLLTNFLIAKARAEKTGRK